MQKPNDGEGATLSQSETLQQKLTRFMSLDFCQLSLEAWSFVPLTA